MLQVAGKVVTPGVSLKQNGHLSQNGQTRLSQKQLEALPGLEPLKPERGWRFPVSQPFIAPGAKESVVKAIETGEISSAAQGVKDLEAQLCSFYSTNWAKCCNSGYSALVLALKNARIGEGDEVLIPSLTMMAVATAVKDVGAKPVFVDCEGGNSLNPSVQQYREAMTKNTKGIIVTHTYGVPADSPGLRDLCNEFNVVFIEDIAEAIGTQCSGKYVGTFGHYAVASLYANKAITAGDGGFVLSSVEGEKKRAESHVNHGFTPGHHFVHWEFSGNYKMSSLQAAFALPSVSKIPEVMQDRERIATQYRSMLGGTPGLELMPSNPFGPDAPWVFGVIVASKEIRTSVRHKMAEDGIETRDFFFPLHLQPCVVNLLGEEPTLPNAERLGQTGFYLPTYYKIADKDLAFIAESLKRALSESSLV